MILRVLAWVAGAGLLAVVAHVSILNYGGYDATSAPMIATLAAGLVVGSSVVGACWRQRRIVLSILIGSALIAAEGYNLILTAERIVSTRDAKQAPLLAAQEARSLAVERVKAAETRLQEIGSSPRLTRALDAKAEADKAVVDKAAERGCASNCRKLLEQQVEIAKNEVDAARAEIEAQRVKAAADLASAKAALEKLPAVASATPLADRLGVAAWKVDLTAAGLMSLAANGLAAFLIAFATHGKRHEPVRVYALPEMQVDEPEQREPVKLESRNAEAEANKFARETFRPSKSGRVAATDVRQAYMDWCAKHELTPLPDREIGLAIRDLFENAGLDREGEGASASIIGIELAKQRPAITHAA